MIERLQDQMTGWQFTWRSIVAFPLVWITIAIPSFIVVSVIYKILEWGETIPGGDPLSIGSVIGGSISASGIISLPVSFLFGGPVHAVLWWKNKVTLKHYIHAGVIGGLLTGLVAPSSFYFYDLWDWRVMFFVPVPIVHFVIGAALLRHFVYSGFFKKKSVTFLVVVAILILVLGIT